MKKSVLATSLMIVTIALFYITFKVQRVEGSESIYIKADGSVDPPTANITSFNNITYFFTGNINDTVVVERNNTVIDGVGYHVIGVGSGAGVYLSGIRNVTIKNMQVRSFSYGVYISESSNINVTGNTITDSGVHGIYLYSCIDNNCIFDNNITVSAENGIELIYSLNSNIFGNNIVDNEAGIYIRSSTHNQVYENNVTDNGGVQVGGGIWLDRADFNTISGNNIMASTWHSVQLERASNNTISGNEILAGTNRAIYVDTYSDYNNITGNNIVDNYKGVEIGGSSHYTIISGNNMTLNGEGIYARYSDYNSIFGNNITDNGSGILLSDSSSNNTIYGNTIINSGNSITLGSSNNNIYGNIITDGNAGISIQHSSNNTLRNNTMTNNRYNFLIMSYSLPNFFNDVDDSNTVDDKPIYYLIDRHDSAIPSNAGCVILVNCTNISIQNVNVSHNWQGVVFAYTTNAMIAESNITNTQYCIRLLNSSNCHINENYLSIFIGIQLEYSSNNTIYGNTITGCGNFGSVGIVESYDNTFYGNNFTDNYFHVYSDTDSLNNWDKGYDDGGNYWDDFKDRYPYVEDTHSGPGQNEPGSDGYWDEPYTVKGDNIDHYPVVSEFQPIFIIPLFMMATLLVVITYRRKHTY